MSKEYSTKSVPSNGVEQAGSVVTKRKHTTVGMSFNISLKVFVVLLVFCLGFILGGLCSTTYRQQTDEQIDNRLDDFNQLVYLYDTKPKLEDYYKSMEGVDLDELHYSQSEVVEWFFLAKSIRPLAVVGPFAVFVSSDNRKFSVCETQSLFPLVELEVLEHSKRLHLSTLREKGYSLPRFVSNLYYSEDGTYEKGDFAVHKEDGMMERVYFDRKGMGVFDMMRVLDHGTQFIYSLNGDIWELVNELPYSEAIKTLEKGLKFKDRSQVHSDSNASQDVDVKEQ